MRQNIFLHKNSRLTTAAADVVWCIVMYYGIFLFFFQRLLEYFFHSLDLTKVSFSHNKISNPNLKHLTVPYKFSNRSSFEFLIFCSLGTRLAPCVKEKLYVFQNWNLFYNWCEQWLFVVITGKNSEKFKFSQKDF